MKIKQIKLYNIGPYIENNIFDLSSTNKKNIVLIGGKNGAGKTTFFKAIKTCLYGCKIWGFDAPCKEYYSFIESIVNNKTQYNSQIKAFVEIVLEFDDGKQIATYTLHREWGKNNKEIVESYNVLKNDVVISSDEMADFNNYLVSIIPPDMFNFYFFDGESIADFFLGSDGNKNFRNAFLKLYGLDTISLLVENFERCFKKKDGKPDINTAYSNSRKELEDIEKKIQSTKEEKNILESQIDFNNMQIQALLDDYMKSGGVSVSQWKDINTEITKEESRRDEVNRWLKEIANHYLPFILVKKQMNSLVEALKKEQESQKDDIIRNKINSGIFAGKLRKYLSSKKIDENEAEELIAFICDSTLGEANDTRLYDLSIAQISKILSQVLEKEEFRKEDILKAVKEISTSLSKTKKLKEKLNSSSIEGYEGFVNEKSRKEKEILELTLKCEKIDSEYATLLALYDEKKRAFIKIKECYEKLLKDKSINNMSERAIGIYTLLEEKLIKRQSKILQEEFINCFSSIINKNNFLDGIAIDKNINIIPYKYIDVSFSQLENYKKKNTKSGFLELFDGKLYSEMNNLSMGYTDSAKLPTPIVSPFSQGERQVYIMSLYLALLKTSKKDVPFFIDTPFARIDSNHRKKIVEKFFKGITNQMFILSTDEEIVGQYKTQIEKNISDKFTLSSTGCGKTEILADSYFGE